VPNARQTQRYPGLVSQLGLQLGQRQIGLGANPSHNLALRFDPCSRLAPRSMSHSFGLTTAVPLSRDFLCPTHAHQKSVCQLLQCAFTSIIGRKKLTAQIIIKGFSHGFFVAESRQNKSTLFAKLL
jgi:hypothetical protein